MRLFRRFEWDTAEYSEAFSCLLRCSSERSVLIPYLQTQTHQLRKPAVAADWGAGNGNLTHVLDQHCSPTFAIEPSPTMREILQQKLPRVRVLSGDIATACPPIPLDYALLAHVLYHLPDEQWPALVQRLLEFQAPGGQLVIIMKGKQSGCNLMLERFGAERFDLINQLAPLKKQLPHVDIQTEHLQATITTQNYQDTETIARFMMCDRRIDEFSTPPTESDFVNYVKTELWNASQTRGGWDYDLTVCRIRTPETPVDARSEPQR